MGLKQGHQSQTTANLLLITVLLLSPLAYIPSSSAGEVISGQGPDATACRFLGEMFKRSVASYEKDFGPVLSSKVRKFGKAEDRNEGQFVDEQLAQNVQVSYFTVKASGDVGLISIDAAGKETLRRLGINVQSIEDVQRWLGKPDYLSKGPGDVPDDQLGDKPIGYHCDWLPGEEKTDYPNTSSLGIDPVKQSMSASFHWASSQD